MRTNSRENESEKNVSCLTKILQFLGPRSSQEERDEKNDRNYITT